MVIQIRRLLARAAELSVKPAVMILLELLVIIPPEVEAISMLDPFSTRISDSFLSGSSLPLLHHLLAPGRINTPYLPDKQSYPAASWYVARTYICKVFKTG